MKYIIVIILAGILVLATGCMKKASVNIQSCLKGDMNGDLRVDQHDLNLLYDKVYRRR
jgi:hypothetical protein